MKRTILITILMGFFSVGEVANAALSILNWNRTATTLSFDLTGTLTDNNPGPSQQPNLFIGTPGANIGADVNPLTTGVITGTVVNNGGSTAGTTIAWLFPPEDSGTPNSVLQLRTFNNAAIVLGSVFDYSVSYTGLTNGLAITGSPIVSWGRSNYAAAPETDYQVGQLIPEPSQAFLSVIGLGGFALRRRRRT